MNILRVLGAAFRALLMLALMYVVGFLGGMLVTTLGSTDSEVWVPGFRGLLNSRNIPDPPSLDFSAANPQRIPPICLGFILLINACLFLYFFVEEYKTPWGVLKSYR